MGREQETPVFFDGQGQPCPERLFSFTDLIDLRKVYDKMRKKVEVFNQTNPSGFVTNLELDNRIGGVLEALHPAVNGHESTRKIRVPRWYKSEEVLIKVAAIDLDDKEGEVLREFVWGLASVFDLHYRLQPNRYDGPFNPAFVFRPSSSMTV